MYWPSPPILFLLNEETAGEEKESDFITKIESHTFDIFTTEYTNQSINIKRKRLSPISAPHAYLMAVHHHPLLNSL